VPLLVALINGIEIDDNVVDGRVVCLPAKGPNGPRDQGRDVPRFNNRWEISGRKFFRRNNEHCP
jgi:hypothetical protein